MEYRYQMMCFIFFLVVNLVSGCPCMWGTHTQTKFCSSGYALNGTVKSVRDEVRESLYVMWRYFTIKVDRVYKEPKGSKLGSEVIIKTGGDSTLCGIILEVNRKVFLNGYVLEDYQADQDGLLGITSCDWVSAPEQLTPQQLKGLEGEYAKNCDCKIDNRWQHGAECNYTDSRYTDGCLMENSYCGRDVESRKCTWVIDHNVNECQKKGG